MTDGTARSKLVVHPDVDRVLVAQFAAMLNLEVVHDPHCPRFSLYVLEPDAIIHKSLHEQ